MLKKPEKTELLILVGLPGAGKTTYYRNSLLPLGYERINEHELGSFDECLRIADRLLADGKSVVIGMHSNFILTYSSCNVLSQSTHNDIDFYR